MGIDDRISAKADKLKGSAKEGFGKATDDDSAVAEGKADQAKGEAKEAFEDVKDRAKELKDDLTDKFGGSDRDDGRN